MDLDPNRPLESNYQEWLHKVNEEANFFVEAWAKAAKAEFSTPEKSFRFLKQMQPELPSSYTPNVEETVNNLSRTIFQDARKQLRDEAQKQKWRN